MSTDTDSTLAKSCDSETCKWNAKRTIYKRYNYCPMCGALL